MTTPCLHLLHRRVMLLIVAKDVSAFAVEQKFSTSIQRQIERATTQFHESVTEKPEAIEENLQNGIVKPAFHNLFLPDPFLNNHRSLDKVTAGEANLERTLEFDHYGENLDDVIDSNSGVAAGSIIDNGMGSKWIFDFALTNFAVELVSTDAEMLGEDNECTTLKSIPLKVDREDTTYKLLTRPESRGVVRDAFQKFASVVRGLVGAITGSPGIGKSWTLLYALQQALLYDGAKVLFFFQKQDVSVMFLRRNNKMYAWKSKRTGFADSALFKRSDVLVLLDPKDAKDGGAKFIVFEHKLLYAASNNKAHFTNSAEKDYGAIYAFLGPPLDNELDVILGVISPTLTPTVIETRKKEVGNLHFERT